LKLLIVDDEAELVATLVRFLSRTGHTGGTAFNLQAAKDYLAQNQPELVITNYRLPDGDGLEIVRLVRQKYPHTPVILMTGDHEPGLQETSRKAGVAVLLHKPFSLKALTDAIRSSTAPGP